MAFLGKSNSNKNMIENSNKKEKMRPSWSFMQLKVFAISIICSLVGIAIRLNYCLRYPVQPRDVFTYESIMMQWEETGGIAEPIPFYPLSLYILKIPHHLFHYDIIKGGIIVNLVLGLFLIIFVVKITARYFQDTLTLLFAGLVVATHPALVQFSCTCLRENTYLFFILLALASLAHYCEKKTWIDVVISSILGAISFLCRLEGLEIIAVFFVILVFLFFFKKIKISKFICHLALFVSVFTLTALTIAYSLDFKMIASNKISSRFPIIQTENQQQ